METRGSSIRGLEGLILWSTLGLAAQGIVLILWADLQSRAAVYLILVPVLAACLLGSKAPRLRCELAHFAVVAGCVGLAMLAGTWLDGGGPHSHHAGHGFMGFWNWSTAGMLAVCIPACIWTRGQSVGIARMWRWVRNLGGLAGMLAGMALGGAWLTGPLTPALGSMFAAHHMAMVVGMTLGAMIGQQGERIFKAAGSAEAGAALVDFETRAPGG